jgi:predicted PurR-regulated permease PerM
MFLAVKGGDNSRLDAFVVFASFVLVTAILYFAKAVFMPIAMATLFTFLLSRILCHCQSRL